MLTFEAFKVSKARPGITEVDPQTVNYKTYQDMLSMTLDEVSNGDFIQVCDKMIWLASSKDPKSGRLSYYSCNGNHIYLFSIKRNTMMMFNLSSKNKLELVGSTLLRDVLPSERVSLDRDTNIIEEEKEMATEMNLDELVNNAVGQSEGTQPPVMDVFNGNVENISDTEELDENAKKKKERIAERAEYHETIKRLKADARTELGSEDASKLLDIWKSTAELVCWITPNEARQAIVASKVKLSADEAELVPGAPEAVKARYNTDRASIEAEYLQKRYKLEAKESKPGTMIGAVVRIPAYLKDKPVQEYLQKIVLDGPKDAAGGMAVLELMSIGDFEQKLTFAGSAIKEDPSTHGGVSGMVRINYLYSKARPSQKGGLTTNKGTTLTKRFVREGSGNKTVLMDGNYFPLVTYETYNIYAAMSEDTVKELNISYFESLFEKGQNTLSKYRCLPEDQQVNLSDKDGVIVSNYITNDLSKRMTLEVKAFYDKTVARDTIMLPVKRRSEKDGKPGSLQFVKYSVTAEDKMEQEEYRKATSLGNGKYDAIIEIVGKEILNPKVLKETLRRSGGGSGTSKVIDHATARAILRSQILGTPTFADFEIKGLKLANQ